MKGSGLHGDKIMLFRVSAISKSSQVKEVDVTYNDLTELPASKAALLGWLEKNKMCQFDKSICVMGARDPFQPILGFKVTSQAMITVWPDPAWNETETELEKAFKEAKNIMTSHGLQNLSQLHKPDEGLKAAIEGS